MSHQYAKDFHGAWVNARTESRKRKASYFCECPDRHRLKLVKPSGLPGKRPFTDFFAHVRDASRTLSTCKPSGESAEHRQAKQMLRERYGLYSFALWKCLGCSRSQNWVPPCRGHVELEMKSANGQWRYDCMVVDDGKPVLALEVFHSHRTKEEKIEDTRQKGIEIIELSAEDILKENMILKNLCCRQILCSDCCTRQALKEQFYAWKIELESILDWDFEMYDMWIYWSRREFYRDRISKKTNFEKALFILESGDIDLGRGACWNIVTQGLQKKYGVWFSEEKCFVGIIMEDSKQYIQNLLHEAKQYTTDSENIYCIWAETIINAFKRNKFDEPLELRDNKYYLLKSFEERFNTCSYCFKYGHPSSMCFTKANQMKRLSFNKLH